MAVDKACYARLVCHTVKMFKINSLFNCRVPNTGEHIKRKPCCMHKSADLPPDSSTLLAGVGSLLRLRESMLLLLSFGQPQGSKATHQLTAAPLTEHSRRKS